MICKQCGDPNRKLYAHGLCQRCYKEQWRRKHGIPKRGEKSAQPCKECGRIPSVGRSLCIRCYSRWWRKQQGEKHRQYMRNHVQKHHFGAHPEIIDRRENEGCLICGMSNEESLKVFDRRLSIHHLDGKGRTSNDPNHDLENLVVLCDRCHRRIHNQFRREAIKCA